MTVSLREAIVSSTPLIAPSVYDGISALVAKELGFQAVYVGSYATGATKYGLPDIGYISADDMADQVRRISAIVDVPIIVDGEGGFGNPLHVARTIRVLQRAGANAVHIEDHDFGKHLTRKSRVIPLDKAVDKIKAAVDAKETADFMVIARTDSAGSMGDSEALRRAVAFQDAGADAVFIPAYGYGDDSAWEAVRREIRVPVVNVNMPQQSAQAAAQLGVNIVLYFALSQSAALQGIRTALGRLAASGSSVELEGSLPTGLDLDNFLGIEAARKRANLYNLIDG
jgi:2-methylisocitrate lyase-like PEP mutase family enzyme